MNRKIGGIGSLINAGTVLAFAICMLIHNSYVSF